MVVLLTGGRRIRRRTLKAPISTFGVSTASPYSLRFGAELMDCPPGNFALGIGDSSDKAYPDRVNLLTQNQASGRPDPSQRFHHVGVKDVVMGKLHTGAITSEARGNLSLCGFGSNGRSVPLRIVCSTSLISG